jgi:adenylate kinase family enzyme
MEMRCLVIGTSGAGKSTFAQALATATDCPYIELDALYWGPDWQAVPTEQFKCSVVAATQGKRWVADGNYSAVRDDLWPRATHVVWLNYGRFTVFSRVLWRTLSRGLLRNRLSHGNRESLRMAFLSKDSILRWSWTTYASNQRKFAALRAQPEFAHLQWTELTRPAQAQAFLAAAGAPQNAGPPGRG